MRGSCRQLSNPSATRYTTRRAWEQDADTVTILLADPGMALKGSIAARIRHTFFIGRFEVVLLSSNHWRAVGRILPQVHADHPCSLRKQQDVASSILIRFLHGHSSTAHSLDLVTANATPRLSPWSAVGSEATVLVMEAPGGRDLGNATPMGKGCNPFHRCGNWPA